MFKKTALALMMVVLASGCAYLPDRLDADKGIEDSDIFPKEVLGSRLSTSFEKPAIEYRKPGGDEYFRISRMEPSDELPDMGVKVLSVNNASVYDSLRILLLDLGINLSMSYETANKTGMYMAHGEGTLPYIVEEIANATDLFYHFKNNTLSFSEEESFVFKIPPMLDDEAEKDILSTMVSLGVDEAAIDSRYNMVTFKTTPKHMKGINSYLKSISEAGSVIVFDTWIWEVALDQGNKSGIKWENFNIGNNNSSLSLSGGSIPNIESASDLIGAISHTTNNLSLTGLVSFLKSHGSLSTLSQPKISLISGSSAKMEVGEEVRYVSELTSTVSTTGETTQSSAQTETLSTGLKLNIYGAYEQTSVFSKITLEISDLLRFNDFAASGTTLSLPHTMIRKIESDTRIEPGEYFILGGVNMSRKQNADTGTPSFFGIKGISMPFSREKEVNKSELVIVMRPRVVVFGENPNPVKEAPSEEASVEDAPIEETPDEKVVEPEQEVKEHEESEKELDLSSSADETTKKEGEQ